MSGEEKADDGSPCGRVHTQEGEGSQRQHVRTGEGPVIFLLKNLKFDPEDDFSGVNLIIFASWLSHLFNFYYTNPPVSICFPYSVIISLLRFRVTQRNG